MIQRYIGDRAFYRRFFRIAIPVIIQNGITNFVSMLDNVMVGRVGTLQMSAVSIVNQLLFGLNREIIVSLSGELSDEVILHLCLTLILSRTAIAGLEFGNHGRFGVLRD